MTTQIEKYQIAIAEAKRFVEKAELAIEDLTPNPESGRQKYQSMHNASAKRASMDLTRALVHVRR